MADPTPAPAHYNSPFEAQFDRERAQQFIIQKLIRGIHTAALVQVMAVRPTAGTVGFVDVQPMVLDQDTNGVVIAQTPVYNIPYLRAQGGTSAVILDPVVNDIGLCLFMARDSSNVCKTRQPGAAPTNRAYSSADGLYIGGVLNADPTQWVKFLPAGGIDIHAAGDLALSATGAMTLTATGAMTITAASLTVNAPTTFNDPVTAPELNLPNGAVNEHFHAVTTTPGNTGVMTS